MRKLLWAMVILVVGSCKFHHREYDKIIHHAMIYDGNGGEPYKGDIGIKGDMIAFIGDLSSTSAKESIDANGMAVAPGFINMMGHSEEALIQDGRSQSDLRQGVTTEIFGEFSMGPLNASMKKQAEGSQGDIKYKVEWNTLSEYMNFLEKKGISCNVASFIGTGVVRTFVVGEDNVAPTPAQLDSMKLLVRQAMEEGALGCYQCIDLSY